MEEKQVNEKTEKAKKAKNRTSLKNIIGGDILATDFFRRQTKLLVMIMLLIIFYIHNRYACQQQMIEIDKLKKDLLNYSQLKDLNLKIIQNVYDEGYSKQDIEKLINSSIQQRDGVLNVANKDSDLMKYQNLSVQYYPAYQRITDNQAILKAFNTKGKILFPQIDKIEGGTINNINEKGEVNALKFMVIVYVKEQLSSQDVVKLKSWMESEANMPVILNVQISSDNEDNIISGNGISW